MAAEVALLFTDAYTENILCFANNIHNVHGGTHLSALKTSVSRVAGNYAKKNNLIKGNTAVTGDDWARGNDCDRLGQTPRPEVRGPDQSQTVEPRGGYVPPAIA